jgi:protein-S-isoprenylcysteine O-methyltransferase Ste14
VISPSPMRMFLRALAAFLALPGIVGGLLPFLILGGKPRPAAGAAPGFALLGAGLVLLLWCVRDFYVSGKGTLAPWDPPRHLVVVGLYRFVRNPMYVAVLTIVAGWGVAYRSPPLGVYLLVLAAGFHLRVVMGEEPWLLRRYGAEWERYCATTPRWLPGPGAGGKGSPP